MIATPAPISPATDRPGEHAFAVHDGSECYGRLSNVGRREPTHCSVARSIARVDRRRIERSHVGERRLKLRAFLMSWSPGDPRSSAPTPTSGVSTWCFRDPGSEQNVGYRESLNISEGREAIIPCQVDVEIPIADGRDWGA